jgi:hypothetical protein
VKIDDAVCSARRRTWHPVRLPAIRLIMGRLIVAQAPLATIGMSGSAAQGASRRAASI